MKRRKSPALLALLFAAAPAFAREAGSVRGGIGKGVAAAPVRAGVDDALRDSAARLSAGDVAGARAKAVEAATAAPRDPRVSEQLARTELAALDFPAAEAAAGRALESGENPARLVLRSEARAGRRNFAGALADAERAILLLPGSGPARFRRAAAKEGLGGSVDEILADYRRAGELDVNLTESAVVAAGRFLTASGDGPLSNGFGSGISSPYGSVTLPHGSVARLPPLPRNVPGLPRPGLGPILLILAVSALFGWVWGRASKGGTSDRAIGEEMPLPKSVGKAASPYGSVAGPEPLLPGVCPLSAREALEMIAAAAKSSAPDPRELAESLYERLTGRPAFLRDTDRALGRYPAASRMGQNLPAGIDVFFARALDPEPSRRFSTAAELVGAFRSLVDPAIL